MGDTKQHQRPIGVKIRKWSSGRSTMMIQFYYRGVVCRETLSMEATKPNLQYAARLRGEIINAIERGTFNYADYFPNSARAVKFNHMPTRISIASLLDQYLAEKEKQLERSTYIRMERNCRTHLYPSFGEIIIQDLTGQHIRQWLKGLTCQQKTMQSILWPLRGVVEQALMDDLIEHNPFDKVILSKIVSKPQSQSRFVIDPFSKEEIAVILDKAEGQVKNLFQFAFFTGLRSSELIGLRWQDIDWIDGQAQIEETIVDKQTKGTKTAAGQRMILLLPPALAALKAQKEHTFLNDHRVFHNPINNLPWETSQQLRRTAWMPLLKRAGVRYRNPYQTRHTFASMMISQGENIMWLSKQMGHADAQVTLRKYARWLPDNRVKGGYQTQYDWQHYLNQKHA